MTPLVFPLHGEPNRPIYDHGGRLVSVSEHAPIFVAAINFVHELSRMTGNPDDGAVVDPNNIRARAAEIMEMET